MLNVSNSAPPAPLPLAQRRFVTPLPGFTAGATALPPPEPLAEECWTDPNFLRYLDELALRLGFLSEDDFGLA